MICGIDEAGRGCLCGSMFIAGVVCDEQKSLWLKEIGIKDSKKLSRTKRSELAKIILNDSDIKAHIVKKTSKDIDSKGLSICLKEAIEDIITHLFPLANAFYMDGNTLFGLSSGSGYTLEAIVKGDDKIIQISAASILAKVAKDDEMAKMDKEYPAYDFKNNSGYGTSKHLKAIADFGQTPFHRKTFLIKNLP